MKKLLLIFLSMATALTASASQVNTTTETLSINGKSVTFLVAPEQSTAYYRLAYMVVVRGGQDVNVLKALVYSAGTTRDVDHLYCATTYAEIATKATQLGITNLPPKKADQP